MMCFRNGDAPDRTIEGVHVCSVVTLAHTLTTRAAVLTEREVQAAASELRRGLPTASAPEPVRRRGFSRLGAAAAVGAIAVAGVLFAISNGLAEEFSDQAPPHQEKQIQPEDKQGKQREARR